MATEQDIAVVWAAGMTGPEAEAWAILAEFANRWLRLAEEHPSEQTDGVAHIHALQRMLLARPTRRAYLDALSPEASADPSPAEAGPASP